jgi:transketolase
MHDELPGIAKKARKRTVEMIYRAKDAHLGCALSAVDILVALYFKVLRIDPRAPMDPDRDRFVLSKGHGVASVYAVLAERGFFPTEALDTYAQNGSRLASHIVRNVVPGAETSGGSGGHGLPIGVGMARAAGDDGRPSRVFVLMGDGELQEGSVWEAAMFAGSGKLKNLTLIVDKNEFQTWTKVSEVVDVDPIDKKFEAFGWEAETVDGHDFAALEAALGRQGDKPRVVIARTVKGKGVSFMEGSGEWHNKSPNQAEFEQAMAELTAS